MLPRLRHHLFFFQDWINKSPVRSNLGQLKYLWQNPKSVAMWQAECIHLLQTHASKTCSFYADYTPGNLANWPVTNKLMMRENPSFLSSSGTTDPLFKRKTSGSTGIPFTSYQNQAKYHHVLAENLFFAEKAGYQIGNRLIYPRIWNSPNQKPKWKFWMQHIIPVEISTLNDSVFRQVISESCKRPSSIYSYGSFFHRFVQFLRENNLVLPPYLSVLAVGEMLCSEVQREFLLRSGSPLCARYSNEENGILAQQLPDSDGLYVVNDAHYFIEILDLNSDQPVPQGTLGRIVVTDLFNYAMPFIRYDTGDIGKMYYNPSLHRWVFSSIEGRKMDQLFSTYGEPVSPHTLTVLFWRFPNILQYRVIQECTHDYTVIIQTNKTEIDQQKLKSEIGQILGKNAQIKLEFIHSPLVLQGYKAKIFENKMVIYSN